MYYNYYIKNIRLKFLSVFQLLRFLDSEVNRKSK